MIATLNVQHNELFIFAAALEKTASLELNDLGHLIAEGDMIVAQRTFTDHLGSFTLQLVDPTCMYAFVELLTAVTDEMAAYEDPQLQPAAQPEVDYSYVRFADGTCGRI